MRNLKRQNKDKPGEKTVVVKSSKHKQFNRESQIYYVLALVFICILFYSNTCYNDYCLDDTMFITENSSTQKGFAGIKEHLGQDLLFGFKHVKSNTAASGGWRPLSLMTYSVEVGLWGKNKPQFSHFINMLLYTAIIVLLFLFLYKHIFKEIRIVFLIALLFAIHPIHSEVVANIKSRDILLCFLFLLMALHQLWKFLSTKKNRHLIFSLLCYFISLTAKEDSITFLIGIPVMLYFFTDIKRKELSTYFAGFLSMAVIYLLIRNAIVPFSGLKSNPEIINNAFLEATQLEAIATKFYVLLLDLKLLVFPHPLIFDYSYNQIPYQIFGNPAVWISILVYIAMLIYGLKGVKSKNVFSFCILMFLLTLSISSNFIVDIGLMFGERMLFFPSLFFCMTAALIIVKIADWATHQFHSNKIVTTAILLLPILISAGYITISRNSDWKDDRTLALADISKSPNSARVNGAAGSAFLFYSFGESLSKEVKDSLLSKTLFYLNRSLQIYSDNNDALLNIGIAYNQMDSTEKAEVYWDKVRAKSAKHPKLIGIDNFLANKYLSAGTASATKNQLDSSLFYFNKALRYSDQNDSIKVRCLYNLGGLYFTTRNYENSHSAFGKVMEIDPEYLNAKVGFEESGKYLKKE